MAVDVIAELRAKRAEATDALDILLAAAVDEEGNARDFNDAEEADFQTLKSQVEQIDRQIKRVEEVQRMKAAAAVPYVQHPSDRPPVDFNPSFGATPREPEAKGAAFSRLVRCVAASKGSHRHPADIAENDFHDPVLAKALAAGSAGSGGFIVPDQYSNDVIEFLRPASVVRAMGARTLTMPGGNLQIPKIASGTSASYVGENTNATPTEPTFGQVQLTARKLVALCPSSNDLIRYSSPQADTLVRDDLVSGIATAEDAAFIRNAGTGNAPKGLRYWAANTTAMNATVNIANITLDLAKLETYLLNANVRMTQPGWILPPRIATYLSSLRDSSTGAYAFPEMMLNKTLRGLPYKTTTAIPVNLGGGTESEVYLADFADVIIGDALNAIVDVSSEAAYHDGTAVVAAFSKDQTVVRVILANDLAVRHAEAVAVLTGVTWGA